MRLELAERLVCPSAHARTPLIVMALETRGRDLIRGTAGCMLCRREVQIEDGDLRLAASAATATPAASPSAHIAERLDRLEAQLNIAEPGARVLLSGRYSELAEALATRADALVVVLNAPSALAPGVGSVFLDEPVVPFSDGSFTAAAFDADIPSAQLADALRTVQRGARVLGALPLPVPVGVNELARDGREWLGERDALPSDVVPLRRA